MAERRPRNSLSRWLSLLCIAPIAALAVSDVPYSSYPEFEYEEAQPVLVVAWVTPGDYLPKSKECAGKGSTCLDAPEWFRARTVMTVYGPQMPDKLGIATMSHLGQVSYMFDRSPRLISLFVKDGASVMPFDSSDNLVRHADGEWYLPLYDPTGPFYLPCSVKEIREELTPQRYRLEVGVIQRGGFGWRSVEQHPELYVVSGDKAVPRYGISMSRLQEFLRGTELRRTMVRCEGPDE